MVRPKDTGLPLMHSAGPLPQRENAAAKDLGAQSWQDTRDTWAGHLMMRPGGGGGAVRDGTPSRGRPGVGQVLPRRRPRSRPLPPGACLNLQPPTLALLTHEAQQEGEGTGPSQRGERRWPFTAHQAPTGSAGWWGEGRRPERRWQGPVSWLWERTLEGGLTLATPDQAAKDGPQLPRPPRSPEGLTPGGPASHSYLEWGIGPPPGSKPNTHLEAPGPAPRPKPSESRTTFPPCSALRAAGSGHVGDSLLTDCRPSWHHPAQDTKGGLSGPHEGSAAGEGCSCPPTAAGPAVASCARPRPSPRTPRVTQQVRGGGGKPRLVPSRPPHICPGSSFSQEHLPPGSPEEGPSFSRVRS